MIDVLVLACVASKKWVEQCGHSMVVFAYPSGAVTFILQAGQILAILMAIPWSETDVLCVETAGARHSNVYHGRPDCRAPANGRQALSFSYVVFFWTLDGAGLRFFFPARKHGLVR